MSAVEQECQRLMALARQAFGAGRLEEALQWARQAVEAAPRDPEPHNVLGVVYRKAGMTDQAIVEFRQSVLLFPRNPPAYSNLGDALKSIGRYAEAAECCRLALAIDPNLAPTRMLLGDCYLRLNQLDAAAEALAGAIALQIDNPAVHGLMAEVEERRGNIDAAIDAYHRQLERQPENVVPLLGLGSALMVKREFVQAAEVFRKVIEIDPAQWPASHGLAVAMARLVPAWHIPMMNEDQRNFPYRDAIRALVRPEDHVLEVGTGAGLLALLSAEAGARHVTTCEMVPPIAEMARRIIEKNGYADRITVVGKHSNLVRIGDDMPERADIMVSEILSNDFVGEGVIPSINDAKARLLKPGARMIPAKGSIRGVLVGGDYVRYILDLDMVCGFDMSDFTSLKPWRIELKGIESYDALSDDVDLLTVDFEAPGRIEMTQQKIPVKVTQEGRCYGVLQWIRIELAPGIFYENHPSDTRSVWAQVLFSFRKPVDVKQGDVVNVHVYQREAGVYITN